jgi:hypothetical protein
MAALERFLAYAQDFERTYADDDWSRLAQYFAPDAVYEVQGTAPCEITGREAIFRGLKKSLDGFDRKFAERRVEIAGPPKAEGDTVAVEWLATYVRPGTPPLVLRGRSVACFAGDAIGRLTDTLTGDPGELAAWFGAHGAGLDPSYV